MNANLQEILTQQGFSELTGPDLARLKLLSGGTRVMSVRDINRELADTGLPFDASASIKRLESVHLVRNASGVAIPGFVQVYAITDKGREFAGQYNMKGVLNADE